MSDANLPTSTPASPDSGGVDDVTVTIGGGNALIRHQGDTVGSRYIEASMVGASRYLDIRKAIWDDFDTIACTQHANAQSSAVQSGVSLEIEFQKLNALLSMKAACMERTEVRILQFVAKLIGAEFDGSVNYTDKFGLRDLSHDLDTYTKSLAVVPSAAYRAQLAKEIAAKVLDEETPPEVFEKIYLELSNPPLLEKLNGN